MRTGNQLRVDADQSAVEDTSDPFDEQGLTVTIYGVSHAVGPEGLEIGEKNPVHLNPCISREHVAIRPVPDGAEVEDLDSHNGTFVDGRLLQPHTPEIFTGDVEIVLAAQEPLYAVTLLVQRR